MSEAYAPPPITRSRNAIYTTEGPIAYFSKKDDIAACLINQINNAKNKIYAAVCFFTQESIANALIAAKSRGVNIDIIVDQKTKQLLLTKLTQNGIIIRVFNNTTSTSIMHNKFALFDNDKVWTGSFNWTYNGNATNYENAVIITNQNLWVQFREEFEKIKAQTHLFQPSQKADQQNSKKRKYDALSNNNQSENDSSYITNTVYH